MTANHYIVFDEATEQPKRWGTCPPGQESTQAGDGETARAGTDEEIDAMIAGD